MADSYKYEDIPLLDGSGLIQRIGKMQKIQIPQEATPEPLPRLPEPNESQQMAFPVGSTAFPGN